MAIAFDTSSIATLANPATSVTWSHTTAAGSDRVLMVAGGIPTTDKLTTVTYNSVSCTKIQAFQLGDSRGCYLHYLVAPATGANNVVISGSSDAWIGAAATYTGVDQSSPIDASAVKRDAGTGSAFSLDVTSVTDNCWLVGSVRCGTAGTAGSGTIIRQTASGLTLADSNSAITPAGATNLNFTMSFAGIGGVIAAIAPVATATTSIKSVNGVLHANIKSWNGVILE